MNTQIMLVFGAGLALIGMFAWMWDWKRFVTCLLTAMTCVVAFFLV